MLGDCYLLAIILDVCCSHMCCTYLVLISEFSGLVLREIDMKDWLTAVRKKGLHPLVYEFLAAFSEGQGQLVLPMIAKRVISSKPIASKVDSQYISATCHFSLGSPLHRGHPINIGHWINKPGCQEFLNLN